MPTNINDSSIFNLFDKDKKDRSQIIAQKIGIIAFSVAFFATFLNSIWKDNGLVVAAYAFGYLIGILAFIFVGIKAVGGQNGRKSFGGQFTFVMKRVFLYLFLPAIIGCALVGVYYLLVLKN